MITYVEDCRLLLYRGGTVYYFFDIVYTKTSNLDKDII